MVRISTVLIYCETNHFFENTNKKNFHLSRVYRLHISLTSLTSSLCFYIMWRYQRRTSICAAACFIFSKSATTRYYDQLRFSPNYASTTIHVAHTFTLHYHWCIDFILHSFLLTSVSQSSSTKNHICQFFSDDTQKASSKLKQEYRENANPNSILATGSTLY